MVTMPNASHHQSTFMFVCSLARSCSLACMCHTESTIQKKTTTERKKASIATKEELVQSRWHLLSTQYPFSMLCVRVRASAHYNAMDVHKSLVYRSKCNRRDTAKHKLCKFPIYSLLTHGILLCSFFCRWLCHAHFIASVSFART